MTFDANMDTIAVTDVSESDLCRWLFGQSPVRSHLASELGFVPDSFTMFQVPTNKLCPHARGPGDIDVLISSSNVPEHTLAIQVKRVKLVPESFHTQLPGKLQDLTHGVQQANLQAELGFHRTFFLVAIVTDGRERIDLNFASRGPTFNLARIIDEFPGLKQLAPSVGLVFIEITQPVDKDITDAGSVGIRVIHSAQVAFQPAWLTTAVARLSGERCTQHGKLA